MEPLIINPFHFVELKAHPAADPSRFPRRLAVRHETGWVGDYRLNWLTKRLMALAIPLDRTIGGGASRRHPVTCRASTEDSRTLNVRHVTEGRSWIITDAPQNHARWYRLVTDCVIAVERPCCFGASFWFVVHDFSPGLQGQISLVLNSSISYCKSICFFVGNFPCLLTLSHHPVMSVDCLT